jgi:hypothetical protein
MVIFQMSVHLVDIFIPGKDEIHQHVEYIFREALIYIIVKVIFT